MKQTWPRYKKNPYRVSAGEERCGDSVVCYHRLHKEAPLCGTPHIPIQNSRCTIHDRVPQSGTIR